MKKYLVLLLAVLLLAGTLSSCGGKQVVTTLPEGMSGTDAAKLMLANQRLNAQLLANQDDIFESGEEVLYHLVEVALDNLAHLSSGDGGMTVLPLAASTVYKPNGGGKLEIDGDTFTWSDFPADSNSYSYFQNLTYGITSTATAGAELIDMVKKHVRVVDQWVSYEGREYYLHVEEDIEVLYSRSYGQNGEVYVDICRRYKNEDGLNVYELLIHQTETGRKVQTRMLYIPGLRCEYAHESDENGNLFDHNFFANCDKGYWEAVDVGRGSENHRNLSYMAMKNDIFYTSNVTVTDQGTELGMVTVVSPDRTTDILSYWPQGGDEYLSADLWLQAYDGVKNLSIRVPKEEITSSLEEAHQKVLVYDKTAGLAMTSGSDTCPLTLTLTNGKTLKVGDTFLDGKVQIERLMVSIYYAPDRHVPSLAVRFYGDTYEEQMAVYRAFLQEMGLSLKVKTVDYIAEGTLRAQNEVEQFLRYGTWNGSAVKTMAAIDKGYQNERARKDDFLAAYNAIKDGKVLDGSNQAELELQIAFSPVTVAEGLKATFAQQTVTVENLTMTASDTMLFVEGESYVVGVALVSTDENDTQGLIHLPVTTEGTTVYQKAEQFAVTQASLSFTVPSLTEGRYTVVAFLATEDGIRTSSYLPIPFTAVAEETVTAGDTAVASSREANGHLLLTVTATKDVHVTYAPEAAVGYEALYAYMAGEAFGYGIVSEEGVIEVQNADGEWASLTKEETALAAGVYRLAYTVKNGDVVTEGYLFLTLA